MVMRGRYGGYCVELVKHEAGVGVATFSDGHAELAMGAPDGAGWRVVEARLQRPAPEGHIVPVGLFHAMWVLAEGLLTPGATSYVAIRFGG